MKRHEMMRQQYRANRYMEHLSAEELEQRARDIMLNQLVLQEDNKIGLHSLKGEGVYWITIFTQLAEEFKLRYGPYPAGFTNGFIKEMRFFDPGLDQIRKACELVKKLKIEPDKYLFKFSEFKWLEQMLKKGQMRISPASKYTDPSLNSAIQDDELKRIINHTKHNKIIQESTTDYYVYCLSCAFTPRLFSDFETDTCLIIKNPQIFIKKVLDAFREICREWDGIAKVVKYFDPLHGTYEQVDIYSFKHFRYSYQKELRFIWLPEEPVQNLDYKYIELGSLEDCCELIRV